MRTRQNVTKTRPKGTGACQSAWSMTISNHLGGTAARAGTLPPARSTIWEEREAPGSQHDRKREADQSQCGQGSRRSSLRLVLLHPSDLPKDGLRYFCR